MDTIQSSEVEDMVPQPLTVEISGYNEILACPPFYSRVSGSSETCLMQFK